MANMYNAMLIFLDVLAWIFNIYTIIGKELAVIFTVYWDPFGRSYYPIYCNSKYYVIGAHNERNRRIVAWFYRWHDIPDDDDWQSCIDRFNLLACPSHYFIIIHTGDIIMLEKIIMGSGCNRGSRTIIVNGKQVNEVTPFGGLIPARIMMRLLR